MKAQELRIGNYVIDKEDNNRCMICSGSMIDNSDLADPIPLTEAWLLKLGFEVNHITKKENKVYRKHYDEGIFDLEKILHFFYGGDFISIAVLYIHELQNLYFALTGEELTIKE